MSWLDYVIITLAVLYTAEVISNPKIHGPFGVFEKLRTRLPLGGLTSCPWCLWPWLSGAFYVLYLLWPPAVIVFAIAGGAAALHSYTGMRHDV